MTELSKKCIGLIGIGLGAAGILASVFIHRSCVDLREQLSVFLGRSEPPHLMIAIMVALGVALIVVGFDFGFRKHGKTRDEHKR